MRARIIRAAAVRMDRDPVGVAVAGPAWQAERMPDDAAVHLEPYDATWPLRFAEEASLIDQAIGHWITGGIHHVGSTAIAGLAAKPVIDIMAGVKDLESSRECIELLAPLGYCYAPYRTDVMHWFCKPNPAHRTHHLHLVPTGSPRFTDVLAFRDHLRQNPEAVAEYEALKRELADRFRHDREAYTEGKSDLISRLTRAAKTHQRTPSSMESAR